ncbi:MAG: type VI secretion system membrane subunit TssM [bacterium]
MFWLEFLKKLPAKWMPVVIMFIWGVFWGVGVKLGFHRKPMLTVAIIATIIAILVWLVLMAIKARRMKKEIEYRRLAEISSYETGKVKKIEEKLLYAIDSLRKSKLGKDVGKKDAQYAVPWFMLIGPKGSGKTSLIKRSGLDFKLRDPSMTELPDEPTKDCDWLFANEAVVMDTTGRFVTQIDKSLDKAEWLNLLDLVKKYRKAKPIDGLIIAMDISRILRGNDDEIEREAQDIRDRVDNIIENLGIKFPVYLIFTKCDLIQGFTDFFNDLTKEEREQILGCSFTPQQQSNPSSAFSDEWKILCKSLKDRVHARLNPDTKINERIGIYLFPRQLDIAYEKLNRFISILFRPSTYLERPTLHGFYLTSSLQEVTPIDLLMDNIQKSYNIKVSHVSEVSGEAKSYFIKEAFTRSIFPNKDLASPTAKAQRKAITRWLVPLGIEFILLSAIIIGISFSYRYNKDLLSLSPSIAERASNIDLGLSDSAIKINELQEYINKLKGFHIFPWRGQRLKVAKALESKFFIDVPIKVLKTASAGEKPKPISGALVYTVFMKNEGKKTDRSGEVKLRVFKSRNINQFPVMVEYQEPGWGIDRVITETSAGRFEKILFEPSILLSPNDTFASVQILFAKLRVLTAQMFDDKNAPIPGVPVSITDPSTSLVLSTGFSDDAGSARLEFKANDGSILNIIYGESGISYPSSSQLRIDPGKFDYSLEQILRTKPPIFTVALESPPNNFKTKDDVVKVKGQVSAATRNTSMEGVFVKIGDQTVPIAAGGFSFDYPLKDGKNNISITVANATQPLSQTLLRTVIKEVSGKPSESVQTITTQPASTSTTVVTTTPTNITPTNITPVNNVTTTPTITPEKPKVARIEISPPLIRLKPSEQETFRALAYDASNKPIVDADFSWNLVGDVGQIDKTSGVFTARKSGTGQITVASGGKSATAQVTVVEAAWKLISSLNKDFRDIYFIDEKNGWAVGYPLLIARTDDGGTTWKYQIDSSSNIVTLSDGTRFGADKLKTALRAVHFVKSGDNYIGWAVGEKGIILHSSDGNQWIEQVSFVDVTLNGVYFIDAMKGWAVGRNGTILYTNNGGTKWNKQTSFSDKILLNNVFFLDSNKGWIVGQGGTILSTNDGGKNWNIQMTPTKKEFLQDVYFINSSKGWIVGTEGLIMHTNNGGQSWTVQVSKTLYNLFGVRFINENEGWVVGENGIILRTSDGGRNWSQTQIGNQNFLGISAVRAGTAWAIGSKGAIASYGLW